MSRSTHFFVRQEARCSLEGRASFRRSPLIHIPRAMSSSTDDQRLTSKERAHLRGLAHDLDPVVRVGKDGLTPSVVDAIAEAFNTRELVKVKILDTQEDIAGFSDIIADRLPGAQVVQVIGSIIVLYRPHPEEPTIELPS